ncbi:hypothetical protein EJ04DRAFT_554429 [Polyplosphaeria fusca]|uniref:Telomeric single stranded DNA binding POT1/Cdc13 domain-containing protein n=1 Tax=Polyplosphaeria fusca TaxID=682080 RepID=A0A9P4QUM3_9PLEO|nr:hypothetical protein EJ04DRAFT_554429 [Polyplosphaeria fusca]
MELTPITALSPELSELPSRQFAAVVTLIWPFSSSTRECAVLLADPDFRLRNRRGQVRVRFTASSARAVAETGIGIGDDVVLSLRGAQFVQEDRHIHTPGKSIDWEIQFSQTVVVTIRRNGVEVASLNLVDATPTPVPASPIRRDPFVTPLTAPALRFMPARTSHWSSPAYLKRGRLSGGSTEALRDPPALNNEATTGPLKKRSRKSWGDWKTWTYSARTPSPEKDEGIEIDDDVLESPTHHAQAPDTSASSHTADPFSIAAMRQSSVGDKLAVEESDDWQSGAAEHLDMPVHDSEITPLPKTVADDFVRDADYYDLYAGPDEVPPLGLSITQEERDGLLPDSLELSVAQPFTFDELSVPQIGVTDGDQASFMDNLQGSHFDMTTIDDHLEPVTAPPALPTLLTNFQPSSTPGMLTPTGREPLSPIIQPLDSSTLPVPSPFPGGRDTDAVSFLDQEGSNQVQIPPAPQGSMPRASEGDNVFIVEDSFYSSMSSANALEFHSTHESAFTDIRFTFGMDGSSVSRARASPPLAQAPVPEMEFDQSLLEMPNEANASDAENPLHIVSDAHVRLGASTTFEIENQYVASGNPLVGVTDTLDSSAVSQASPLPLAPSVHHESEIILLSSDSEPHVDAEVDDTDVELDSDRETNIYEMEATDASEEGLVSLGDVEISASEEEHAPQDASASPEPENHGVPLEPLTDDATTTPLSTQSGRLGFDEASDGVTTAVELDVPTGDGQHPESVYEIIDLGSSSGAEAEDIVASERAAPEQAHEFEKKLVDPAHPGATDFGAGTLGPFANSEDSTFHPHLHVQSMASINKTEAVTQALALDEHGRYPDTTSKEDMGAEDMGAEAMGLDGDLDHVHLREHQEPQESTALVDEFERHPDIKVESIEEDTPAILPGQREPFAHDEDAVAGPPNELLIEIPEDGHKIGEMHTISVSATGPARNTRSKTKSATSPTKAEEQVSSVRKSTRSSRISSASSARITRSPPHTRSRSTVSPVKDITRESPYSLRSKSNDLSPIKARAPLATSAFKPPRKSRAAQDPIDSPSPRMEHFATKDRSWLEPINLPASDMPEELHPSQGKFSNVSFVADSTEDSLHSEQSISTSQPGGHEEAEPARGHSEDLGDELSSSPARSNWTLMSSATLFNSLQKSKWRNEEVDDLSLSASKTGELSGSTTPRATLTKDEIAYPKLPLPDPDEVGNIRSSPPQDTRTDVSVGPQSLVNSNMPMTPDATQTKDETQPSPQAGQSEQSLPMTPQLTQKTSVAKSFEAEVEMEQIPQQDKARPSLVATSTPRRNVTAVDVASAQASPSLHSEDLSDSEASVKKAPREAPSIGLSTPISYYTPLKDLAYFLNRSSQFHSSSNPDVLALVTSATTTPKKADKGPRHWNTTLHVTDVSLYPAESVVQMFRPFSSALPTAAPGDVVLLRAFQVKSLNRKATLVSGEESAWCVWRWGRPIWGRKRGAFGEVKSREEVKGPAVERGEGEWAEVERLRAWWDSAVKAEWENADGLGEKGTKVRNGTSRGKGKGKGKAVNESEA